MPSVFGMGTAATDKLFLEYILPGLNVEIRENTIMYDRFGTDSKSVSGSKATFKAITGAAKSARPSSSSTLPTAKQGTYKEFNLYMKRGMYAQLQFDGLALACGKGKGAVMDILKAETKGITIQIANKLNRQFWGDGSGRLAQTIGATSNSVTVIVNGPLFGQDSNYRTNAANYLDEGQEIDIYTTAGVLEAEGAEISSMVDNNDGTTTLTLAAAVTCSNDAYIFDTDTYCATQAAGTGVPMGLMGIINTANPYDGITSGSYQGQDRTAAGNGWTKSQLVTMGSAAISNAKILETVMAAEKYGRVKVAVTNEIIWRSFYQILETDKTMPNEPAFWGGTSGISFYGGRSGKFPIIYDTDCPDNNMFFLDDSLLQVYAPEQNGMTWLPGDSGVLTRVQGKDEFVASLIWYYNFGSAKPQGLGRLYAIKHAAS